MTALLRWISSVVFKNVEGSSTAKREAGQKDATRDEAKTARDVSLAKSWHTGEERLWSELDQSVGAVADHCVELANFRRETEEAFTFFWRPRSLPDTG